jgi:hypothetical protein
MNGDARKKRLTKSSKSASKKSALAGASPRKKPMQAVKAASRQEIDVAITDPGTPVGPGTETV